MDKMWKYFIVIIVNVGGLNSLYYSQAYDYKKEVTTDVVYKNAIKLQDEGRYLESIELFEKSYVGYSKLNLYKNMGDCNSYIAISYSYLGNYEKALFYFNKSEANYKKSGYIKGVSSVKNNIGGIYFSQGKYADALDSFSEVLSYAEKAKDLVLVATTTQNIGNIYNQLEDYKHALIYFDKSIKLFNQLEINDGIIKNLAARATIFIKQKKFSLAEESLNKAFEIGDTLNNTQILMELSSSKAVLLYEMGKYEVALLESKRTLDYAKQLKSKQYLSESRIGLGKIYLLQNETNLSISECYEGLKFAQQIGSISLQKEACDCLYKGYKKINKDNLALNYYEKFNLFEDSLQSKEISNRVLGMEFQKRKLLDSIRYVKKEHTIQLKHKEEVQEKESQKKYILGASGLVLLLAGGLYSRLRFVKKTSKEIQIEKDKSDQLLLNILPEEVANELKAKGSVSAKDFSLVTILFSDFKSFTQTAEKMTPKELVEEINICFKEFDHISTKYNIEKIKTIGDSYMAAGGMNSSNNDFIVNTVLASLEMQEFIIYRKNENGLLGQTAFEMRTGIHCGPVVAGIVGVKKFQYDVWGDTVNTASRIESNGSVGKVNISESLYELIKDNQLFEFEYRGVVQAKGKGEMRMYFVKKKSRF